MLKKKKSFSIKLNCITIIITISPKLYFSILALAFLLLAGWQNVSFVVYCVCLSFGAEDTYERTLTVDGEETTLIVMDTWENDRQVRILFHWSCHSSAKRRVGWIYEQGNRRRLCKSELCLQNVWYAPVCPPPGPFLSSHLKGEDGSSQDACLKVGSAYVIVYSVTDRSSFDSASELRITLRRTRQAEDIPIILVGNKSDLVRSREVAVEGDCQRSNTHLLTTTNDLMLCVCFTQRAERARWCSTVSSLRHRRRCSTTCPNCLRESSGRSASGGTAVGPSSADAPSTNARRASPRKHGASWTDLWHAITSAWRSKHGPRAATTWLSSEETCLPEPPCWTFSLSGCDSVDDRVYRDPRAQ